MMPQAYVRAMALWVLVKSPTSMTAAEIADRAVAYAQAEAHPAKFWRSMSAVTMFGALRGLERAAKVEQAETERPNSRRGAPSPTWRHILDEDAAKEVRVPDPEDSGDEDEAVAERALPAGAGSYVGMSKTQIYTLLEVQDMYLAETARHVQEVSTINSRARRMLADVGLGPE